MQRRIVVGIDGSGSAADALRWAVDQARLTGATVDAVYAWDPGPLVSVGAPPFVDWEPLRAAAEERPQEIVSEVIGTDDAVLVIPRMVMGNPGQVWLRSPRMRTCSWSAHAASGG